MNETGVHIAVADVLRAAKVDFFHPPNGVNITSHKTRELLKKKGLSAGVSDLIIVTPPPVGGYVAAALEIKAKTGNRPTDAQFEWLDKFELHGWAVGWAKGFDACVELLTKWGYLRKGRR